MTLDTNALEKAIARQRREPTTIDLDAFWRVAAQLPNHGEGYRDLNAALHLRYHDDGTTRQQYKDIAAEWGVSVNRVRQVIEKALWLMRNPKRMNEWVRSNDP